MDLGLISVRYSRALLKASMEAKLEDKMYQEMKTLSESYIKVPELKFTIDNPMLSNEKKEKLLITASGEKLCDLTKTFFKLVLKEDRESIMQFIANSYLTLYRRQKKLIRAKLLTAVPVTPVIEQKLRKLVEGRTNGTVEFESEIDSNIIGGFILEYDTYKLDLSVKSKLNSILSQLK